MKAIEFDYDLHYGFAAAWWSEHPDWEPIPKDFLPKTGVIVFDAEKPIACGFLYKTDSKFEILDHIVANPNTHYLIRSRGLDVLLDALLKKTEHGSVVVSFLQHERLIDRHLRHGFKKGDTNLTMLLSPGGGSKWQQ